MGMSDQQYSTIESKRLSLFYYHYYAIYMFTISKILLDKWNKTHEEV